MKPSADGIAFLDLRSFVGKDNESRLNGIGSIVFAANASGRGGEHRCVVGDKLFKWLFVSALEVLSERGNRTKIF